VYFATVSAIGDHVIATILFKPIKKQGYHLTYITSDKGLDVIKNNPYIDEVQVHVDDSIPRDQLDNHWNELSQKYDKFVNLSRSIEMELLPNKWDWKFRLPKEDRHRYCNKNYYDWTLGWAGYGNIRGKRGELFLDAEDEKLAKAFLKKHFPRDAFVILWAMSGSSLHKTYPWQEFVVDELIKRYPNIYFITTGDDYCRLIEWENKRTINVAGKWSIRRSIVMTKYVDLVIGPETGLLNAAGCFPTPKILMLSHSTEENISKYWMNHITLHCDPEVVKCWPCHKLVHGSYCSYGRMSEAPACISNISPAQLLKSIEYFYNQNIRRAA
jgi:ADP-heptose:LPS heptosyltransferase